MENFRAAAWRLGIFLAVCLLGAFALVTVFGQFRFEKGKNFVAEFANVTGLKNGDIVRIAGVEVGKVQQITVNRDASVRVEFSADESVILTDGSRAVIRYDDLIGNRFLALEEGAGGVRPLKPAVSCTGPETGQRVDRAVDRGVSGTGPNDRVVPESGGGGDQHLG
jgi:phospholipid/cholesterol/gamma-HCH transport system substrate-binding protein